MDVDKMTFKEVGVYARLLGYLPPPHYRHLVVTTAGFLLLCLYFVATTRVLLRTESFFPLNSTIHMYADILSSTVSAISVSVAFIGNALNSKTLQLSLSIGHCIERQGMRRFWIFHAVTNGVNVAVVLATCLILRTPSSLEYVFFHCYEAWALSLEALLFYAVGNHWTCQYRLLNRDALNGEPLDIAGRHAALTKAAISCVNQLEVQLMFATCSGFVRLVVLAFYAAEAAPLESGVWAMAQYARQAVLCAVVLVVIARAGESLHQEAALTAKCLHSVAWGRSNDSAYVKQLISASLHLLSQPLRLKLWGLLFLDNTLLFTVTGAACTYVVVLLQFAVSPALRAPSDNYTEHYVNTAFE